jgi:hypothetical protein
VNATGSLKRRSAMWINRANIILMEEEGNGDRENGGELWCKP